MNNFASGVMDKLGVGYDVLRRIKPDIIMVSLPGYGTSGPGKRLCVLRPAAGRPERVCRP